MSYGPYFEGGLEVWVMGEGTGSGESAGVMTDNEKAATYIGWKPDTWCLGCDLISPEKHAELAAKFNSGHYVPAPNMGDPRNYMKALEAIQARTHHGPIEMQLSCERDDDWKPVSFSWSVRLYKVLEDEHSIDWGEPMAVLAALYDAEHADAK